MPDRPRLRRGVRLSYDKVRATHVLLYPEGVLVPNGTAAAVLRECDGSTTVREIASRLGTRFRGVRAADVANVLERLAERRVVEWT
ncbi:MAG TPA: pyrroloquinoline quinone biosynthesis peptide chaperone PqqD [Actinophytocola sp.]|jgi:pyrroloquinoline quinone biosynthesis protein D|uniref:pyrroloquinoline quinone biosynthesis peptide chaperone PqqD n=1 Tax=Actinophytocola sp. TaxID=1872138 RepID=UPI002F93F646